MLFENFIMFGLKIETIIKNKVNNLNSNYNIIHSTLFNILFLHINDFLK